MARNANDGFGVGGERDATCRGSDVARITGGRASVANQPVAVAHRTWYWVALVPTELSRRRIETLHQRTGGERDALDRIGLGVVHAPEFNGIHVELMCELVHRAFERKHVRSLGGRPHESGSIAVRMHDIDGGVNIGAGIHARRRLDAGDIVWRGPRGHLPALVRE